MSLSTVTIKNNTCNHQSNGEMFTKRPQNQKRFNKFELIKEQTDNEVS
jgi:hypothetical protein